MPVQSACHSERSEESCRFYHEADEILRCFASLQDNSSRQAAKYENELSFYDDIGAAIGKREDDDKK